MRKLKKESIWRFNLLLQVVGGEGKELSRSFLDNGKIRAETLHALR